ncbi:indoleamine 2,3-dioxygenase 2-like [Lingula anatina]|uniref:Indoleamine 2,3-dioxygenase 2-like n=1 Tax=Lingula anatina TaxID=7574 RepID=A0A1S3IDV1_LINAN|nr:indoleamine 2,3-dioxygenase 2-like [Lingula anatina]|eukprot:XP_013395629.1 indoleamine 2,3-dioxygenase 2-like [Lingula anatina]
MDDWWKRLKDFRVSEKVGFLVENPVLQYLDYTGLQSYEEYCLAHSLLSTIAHCYVWQDRDKGVIPKVLPRAVAVPWYHVSQYLGLNPVYCYMAGILANWRKESEDSSDIERICCAPGSPQTDWFFIVSVLIEIDFGKGVKDIIKTYQALTTGDDDGLIEGLQGMADTIQRMQQTLSRMHEKQDPWTFYHKLRPFFEGWGAQSKFLPEGLIYEGVSDSPLQYLGASAAQSSTIQTFDAIFEVKHTAEAEQYLRKIREYMPASHREFLNAIENGPSLRHHARLNRDDSVRKAYNKCIQALTEFRSYHITIAVKYILLQSYQKDGESSNITEAQGVGGTYLVSFLKSTRGQTARCILGDSETDHVTWQADDTALVGLKMEISPSLLHPGTNHIVNSESNQDIFKEGHLK